MSLQVQGKADVWVRGGVCFKGRPPWKENGQKLVTGSFFMSLKLVWFTQNYDLNKLCLQNIKLSLLVLPTPHILFV